MSTTSHELVYGTKTDLHVLVRLFPTGYFHKVKDSSYHCSGISTSTSMQGIAIGRCRKTDGMLFYSPHSKEIFTSSDYKLDEGRHTPTAFNLSYDGGIFIGLYNHNTSSSVEPYPEGTPISYPTKLNPSSNHTTYMRGMVISAPLPPSHSGTPISDKEASPYITRLIDSSPHQVSPDLLEQFITTPSSASNRLNSQRGKETTRRLCT
jgi:hypothetical protein